MRAGRPARGDAVPCYQLATPEEQIRQLQDRVRAFAEFALAQGDWEGMVLDDDGPWFDRMPGAARDKYDEVQRLRNRALSLDYDADRHVRTGTINPWRDLYIEAEAKPESPAWKQVHDAAVAAERNATPDRSSECPGFDNGGTGEPCCDRAGEYNGFASGPTIFTCPKHCGCHD
jgi:hypothetical protein